jgi:hypothetical protein
LLVMRPDLAIVDIRLGDIGDEYRVSEPWSAPGVHARSRHREDSHSLFAMMFSGSWRRVKLTESTLHIPKRLGASRMAVSDVAGVGLLFCWQSIGGPFGRWDLFVWRSDGCYERCPSISCFDTAQGPPGLHMKPRIMSEGYVAGWLARADASRLASSRPGRIATDLYQRVLAVQGTDGPLARCELQKQASWSNRDRDPLTILFWSPDGEMGAARWAQEREAPPPIGWANR